MIQTINDWKPETRSLLKSITDRGGIILGGHNGEDAVKFDGNQNFLDELLACDEANLYIQAPDGRKLTVYLVLGNEPGVIASDYTCHELLDAATDEHYDKWCDRKQPKITGEYRGGRFVAVKGGE